MKVLRVSFLFMIYGVAVKYIAPETVIPGWSSTFSAILFLGGVQLICLGIIGEYLARTYDEAKKRTLYFVKGYHPAAAPAESSSAD